MYKAPRGTQDKLPSEQSYWAYVTHKAQGLCQLYGYQRLDTPTFEEAGLFQRSIGEGTDIVEKEMYTFKDHGGDLMTLRPEGTAPVCRAYIEHGMQNLPQPVRLYYLSPIFRYERPQAGRFRQHHQFGCEAIGDEDPSLDAEIIELAWRLCESLGLRGLTLQLNSIGCPECRPLYLQRLKQYYTNHSESLCQDCKARLVRNPLRLLDCKKPICKELAQEAPSITDHLCATCNTHFNDVQRLLATIEIPFTNNPFLVRGLDYYTRTVFELHPKEEGAQSALGGGGRYDLLIEELGGKPSPAIGFATGLERLILNLQRQDVAVPNIDQPSVFITYLDYQGKVEAVRIASSLRHAGIGANTPPGGRSLKAQLKQANARGASHAVIVGGEELERGNITIRDLTQGQQQEIPIDQVVQHLSNLQQGPTASIQNGVIW
ncbi:MAG: histidine--tRNA ligase [Chloroflexota bacterium]|nr:histidine--tRNA ligase [Chloroflexota bacterium]